MRVLLALALVFGAAWAGSKYATDKDFERKLNNNVLKAKRVIVGILEEANKPRRIDG